MQSRTLAGPSVHIRLSFTPSGVDPPNHRSQEYEVAPLATQRKSRPSIWRISPRSPASSTLGLVASAVVNGVSEELDCESTSCGGADVAGREPLAGVIRFREGLVVVGGEAVVSAGGVPEHPIAASVPAARMSVTKLGTLPIVGLAAACGIAAYDSDRSTRRCRTKSQAGLSRVTVGPWCTASVARNFVILGVVMCPGKQRAQCSSSTR